MDFLHLHGLQWSNVSKFMRLRISQLAASIPLIGYLLLWSEKFKDLSVLQTKLLPGQWFETTTRLQLIYYGAIALGVAWSIYQVRCPRIIKRHPSLEDYLLENATMLDNIGYDKARSSINAIAPRAVLNGSWAFTSCPPILRTVVRPETLAGAFEGSDAPGKRALVFHAFYLGEETRNAWSLGVASLLALIGVLLVLIPSFEVFVLVTRQLLLR